MTLRGWFLTTACLTVLSLTPSPNHLRAVGIGQRSNPGVVVGPRHLWSEVASSQALAPRTLVPLAVDGAKTPELVPDDIAYYHFIMSAATTSNPSAEEVARRGRAIDRILLSQADSAALIGALAGVREELDRISISRRQLLGSADDESALQALKTRESSTLDAARTRLTTVLSVSGLAKLDLFIQQSVKRQIVIYEM